MAKSMLKARSAGDESLELDPAGDPLSQASLRHLAARYGSPLLVIDAERVIFTMR